MIGLLRWVAGLVVVGAFTFWLARHKRESLALDPRTWLKTVRRMDGDDWGKLLALCSVLTLITWITIPYVTSLTEAATNTQLVNPQEHPAVQIYQISPVLLMVMMAIIPIVEEFMFRHLLLRKLKRYGKPLAVGLSALAFGAFHLLNSGTYLFAFVPPAIAGIIFGVAYLLGGLKASTVTHIAYNELLILL